MAKRRTPSRDDALKQEIYDAIQQVVRKALTEKGNNDWRRINREAAKVVFDTAMDVLFAGLLRDPEGYFRLPMGYGVLKIRTFKARPAKLMPTRENLPEAPVALPEERRHLRLVEGATTKKALGNYRGNYERKGDGPVPRALADSVEA